MLLDERYRDLPARSPYSSISMPVSRVTGRRIFVSQFSSLERFTYRWAKISRKLTSISIVIIVLQKT